MAIQTNAMKEHLADRYGDEALFGALYTTAPGGSPGTEVSGGSPAYARKSLTWTAGGSDGIVTASATFDVPASTTVRGVGVHTAVTAGTYLDGVTVSDQVFASQGTLVVNFTFTET